MIKLWLCLIAVTIATATPLYAVPAAPHLHDLQQPDGTKILAHQWGDEHSHGWETDTGHTIVFDEKIKGWAYAIHDKKGKLTSSSVLVTPSAATPAGNRKHLRPLKAAPISVTTSQTVPSSPSSLSAPILSTPVIGSKSLPVIMIDFPSYPFVNSRDKFNNLLFGSTGNTLRNYYLENSYNKLLVDGGPNGVFGSVTSDYTRSYYGAPKGMLKDSYAGTLVYEAVSKAASAGFKFVDYVDQAKSCYVDAVVIIHQGTGQESGFDANDIWSHSWDLISAYGSEFVTNEPCSLGGFIKVNNYTIQPELAVPSGTMVGVGVFAHEFGHVLGLPDLYDTDDSSNGVGNWSLMASGMWLGKTIGYLNKFYSTGDTPSHLDLWSKFYLGWVSPTRIDGTATNVSVSAASTSIPNFYTLGSGTPTTGEYFLVENRQKSGFDSYLPGAGLLVWHIDGTTVSNLQSDNKINNNECLSTVPGECSSSSSHYGVALIQADNLLSLENKDNNGNAGDPFLSTNNLSDSTAPNSKLWNGTDSGFGITSISASAAKMTATFTVSPVAPAAPAITSVAAGNSLASIYFTAPSSDGGSPIINYTAMSSSGTSVTSDTVPITVSGLVNGNSYTFTVKATNSAGTSSASAAWAGTPGVVVIEDAAAIGYQLLQDAYEANVLSKKLKIMSGASVGELSVNLGNNKGEVVVEGGYNDALTVAGGSFSILSKVTLSAGTTKLQNVIVK